VTRPVLTSLGSARRTYFNPWSDASPGETHAGWEGDRQAIRTNIRRQEGCLPGIGVGVDAHRDAARGGVDLLSPKVTSWWDYSRLRP